MLVRVHNSVVKFAAVNGIYAIPTPNIKHMLFPSDFT